MAIWLDIVGSLVLGGLLALNAARLKADLTAQTHLSSMTYIASSSAGVLGEIVEADMRDAGYGVAGTALLQVDSTAVRFLSDLDDDGTADTLALYVGPTSEVAATSNPRDRILYREVAGSSDAIRMGVTRFRMTYFNLAGNALSFPVNPDSVRHLQADITVESSEPYDNDYATAFATVRVRPRNL